MVERVLRCMLLLCFLHAGTTFSVTPFVRSRPSPPARQFRLWPQPQKLASTRSVPGLPPPTVLAGSVDSDVEPICSEEIFTLEANFSLAARVWRHPGPATSTRPEDNWLALHGYADSAASYDLLAPLLIKDGAACVVALDFAGHGLSDARHSLCYHDVDMMLDVIRVGEALGWASYSVVGHSYGGCVGQAVAAAVPARVLRLLALEALAFFSQEEERMGEVLQRLASSRPRRPAPACPPLSPSPSPLPLCLSVSACLGFRCPPLCDCVVGVMMCEGSALAQGAHHGGVRPAPIQEQRRRHPPPPRRHHPRSARRRAVSTGEGVRVEDRLAALQLPRALLRARRRLHPQTDRVQALCGGSRGGALRPCRLPRPSFLPAPPLSRPLPPLGRRRIPPSGVDLELARAAAPPPPPPAPPARPRRQQHRLSRCARRLRVAPRPPLPPPPLPGAGSGAGGRGRAPHAAHRPPRNPARSPPLAPPPAPPGPLTPHSLPLLEADHGEGGRRAPAGCGHGPYGPAPLAALF